MPDATAPHGLTNVEQAREFWLRQRQALLMQVDAIERLMNIAPRTAELRQKDRQPERSATE